MKITPILKKKMIRKFKKITGKKGSIIEKSISCFVKDYCDVNNVPEYLHEIIYKNKCDTILYNLNKKNETFNDYLLNSIMNNKIDLENIGYLLPYELNPNEWSEIIEKKKYVEKKLNTIETTDIHKCPKCGERKSVEYQKQTRAADESMTTFVTCIECGYVMKF